MFSRNNRIPKIFLLLASFNFFGCRHGTPVRSKFILTINVWWWTFWLKDLLAITLMFSVWIILADLANIKSADLMLEQSYFWLH